MRKGSLLFVSLVITGICLYFLIGGMVRQYREQSVPVVATVSRKNHLPRMVDGTPLRLVRCVCYEGPYLEDGSYREVVGIQAVVVENTGGSVIDSGTVLLEVEETLYYFSFTKLPGHASMLVLEDSAKKYTDAAIVGCTGSCTLIKDTVPQNLILQESGKDALEIRNGADKPTGPATLYFKTYDAQSQLLIGGYTFSVQIPALKPGETYRIHPYRYVIGYSRVVLVDEKTCRQADGT